MRWQGERALELVWFAFLFRVGLTQLFVGVALSESGANTGVGLGRQFLWLGVDSFWFVFGTSCWALALFRLRGGRGSILLSSRG